MDAPSNFDGVLKITRCTMQKQPASTSATRRARPYRMNRLEVIPESASASPINAPFNRASPLNSPYLVNENIRSKEIGEFGTRVFTPDNQELANKISGDVEVGESYSASRPKLSKTQQAKSGVVVLLGDQRNQGESSNLNTRRELNNCRRSNNCCRTPVMLKVFHSNFCKYLVITPARSHSRRAGKQGSVTPTVCLKLRKCQAYVEPTEKRATPDIPGSPRMGAVRSPLTGADNSPCCFTLVLGGGEGKSFRFEASSLTNAVEWSNALAGDSHILRDGNLGTSILNDCGADRIRCTDNDNCCQSVNNRLHNKCLGVSSNMLKPGTRSHHTNTSADDHILVRQTGLSRKRFANPTLFLNRAHLLPSLSESSSEGEDEEENEREE